MPPSLNLAAGVGWLVIAAKFPVGAERVGDSHMEVRMREGNATLAVRTTGAAIPSLVETARSLKTLRALTSSDDGQCGLARSALDAAVGALQRRSRQQRNLNHSVHALLRKTGVTLRLPCELCTCPEPSVPPVALRQFLGMYGALLTELRGRPRALAEIVHRGAGPPESAVQLLLCFVFGHLWQPDEEAALLDVSERLLFLRVQASACVGVVVTTAATTTGTHTTTAAAHTTTTTTTCRRPAWREPSTLARYRSGCCRRTCA